MFLRAARNPGGAFLPRSSARLASTGPDRRCLNFTAGPARLADEVMLPLLRGLQHFDSNGMNFLELNQRQPNAFRDTYNRTVQLWRELLGVPKDYTLMFMHGGAVGQFAAVPMNLYGGPTADGQPPVADYYIAGHWSRRAALEAERFGSVRHVGAWEEANASAPYFFYCGNETISGLEIRGDPPAWLDQKVPVVADLSSNLLQRRIDVSKYSLLFCTGGKNLPLPGLCLVVVKNSLLGRHIRGTPSILEYKVNALQPVPQQVNTYPPVNVLALLETAKWMKEAGGLPAFEAANLQKEALLTDVFREFPDFYQYLQPEWGPYKYSGTTIAFKIAKGSEAEQKALEERFLAAAEARDMYQLAGHVSVGHLRVALYNVVPVAWVAELAAFLRDFARANGKL